MRKNRPTGTGIIVVVGQRMLWVLVVPIVVVDHAYLALIDSLCYHLIPSVMLFFLVLFYGGTDELHPSPDNNPAPWLF